MHRRSLFWLLAAATVTGCGQHASARPSASPSHTPSRPAVADDYRWLVSGEEFAKGFSFVWVQGLTTRQALERLGGEELERVYWHQLAGPGNGQRVTTDRRFFGMTRLDNWVLVVEDNGDLAVRDDLLGRLSAQTTVVAHHRGADLRGRLTVLTDGVVGLRFDPQADTNRTGTRVTELAGVLASTGVGAATDPAGRTAAAFAFTERLTGLALTRTLLEERSYILGAAPRK